MGNSLGRCHELNSDDGAMMAPVPSFDADRRPLWFMLMPVPQQQALAEIDFSSRKDGSSAFRVSQRCEVMNLRRTLSEFAREEGSRKLSVLPRILQHMENMRLDTITRRAFIQFKTLLVVSRQHRRLQRHERALLADTKFRWSQYQRVQKHLLQGWMWLRKLAIASGRRCNAWATFYMKAIDVKYLRPRKRALLKQRWLKARLGLALEGYGSLDLELAAMLGETYMGTHRNHTVLVHTACCRKIQRAWRHFKTKSWTQIVKVHEHEPVCQYLMRTNGQIKTATWRTGDNRVAPTAPEPEVNHRQKRRFSRWSHELAPAGVAAQINRHGGSRRNSITEIASAVTERAMGRLIRGDCIGARKISTAAPRPPRRRNRGDCIGAREISTAPPRPPRRRKSTSIYVGCRTRRGRESMYREMPQVMPVLKGAVLPGNLAMRPQMLTAKKPTTEGVLNANKALEFLAENNPNPLVQLVASTYISSTNQH